MFEAHDALICIAEGAYLATAERRRYTPEHRFKSAAEMRELFADLPEALDNTLVVARRCAYMPEPRTPMLPSSPTEGGRGEADELRVKAEEGLRRRLETHVFEEGADAAAHESAAKPYWQRLEYELDVIIQMG
jgi:DNA polymerase-3 subunit alpha